MITVSVVSLHCLYFLFSKK